ncbi:MAG: amino acid ABC transporter substrate-binding protein [Cohaesibacteraceae bacterium]|nr:amino acid ABC transporter substrate-binding protein [Cohaesibacteraceae bacterium]
MKLYHQIKQLLCKILSRGIVLLAFWVMPHNAMAGELVFVTDHYPPYEFMDKNNTPTGFDVDVLMAAFARLEIPIRIELRPWKRAVDDTRLGKVTGMFSCSKTPGREKFAHYSDVLSQTTPSLIVKKSTYEGSKSPNLEDMRKMTIGVIAGYSHAAELRAENVPVVDIPEVSYGLTMLMGDRFTGFHMGRETGLYMAAQAGLADKVSVIPIGDQPRLPFHLCFSKKVPGYKELAAKFNKALKLMRQNGELDAIYAKYR